MLLEELPQGFKRLSAEIGSDPLLVQGPGGNTSVKQGGAMWIKASGTMLSDAETGRIFVPVDPAKALAEIDGSGDGSCRNAVLDPRSELRPSVETTFHALFPQKFVFHYHSVATICHSASVQGRIDLVAKLYGLDWADVRYRKPGVPLAKEIRSVTGGAAPGVTILENHGVIIAADEIEGIARLRSEVEKRLHLPVRRLRRCRTEPPAVPGWEPVPEYSALVEDHETRFRALSGSYYPDHVVFLGPALPVSYRKAVEGFDTEYPVVLHANCPYLRKSAPPAARAMLRCLFDVLSRIPRGWRLVPIPASAEDELLNWDAEKYRKRMSARR